MFETLLLVVTLCTQQGCDRYAIDVLPASQWNECSFRAGQLQAECEPAMLDAGDYMDKQ